MGTKLFRVGSVNLSHAAIAVAALFFMALLPRQVIAADGTQTIKQINGPTPEPPVRVWGTYIPPTTFDVSSMATFYSGGGRTFFNGIGNFSFNNKTATTDKKKDKAGCQGHVGDPVEVDDGAKLLQIPLFQMPGEMGLKYVLYYHSVTSGSVWAYNPWASSISYILDLYCGFTNPNIECSKVTLFRPDGSSISFSGNHASYGNFPEIGGGGLATLVHNSNSTWTLHDEDSNTLTFDSNGYFNSIKDVSGVGWTISSTVTISAVGAPKSAPPIHPCSVPTGVRPMCIDPPPPPPPQNKTTTTVIVTHTDGQSFKVVSIVVNQTTYMTGSVTVTDPAGNQYSYPLSWYEVPGGSGIWAYDVASLTFPGSPATTMTFSYTGSNQLLSGVAYNGTAYWSTSYNSNNEVSSDGAADGTERTSIVYTPVSGGMVATITNPLGLTTTNTYTADSQGNYLLSKVSNSAVQGCGATTNSLAWDANDNLTKTVDNDGITHTYHYAANGQLQTETEAYGSATARTTNYVWDPSAQLNRLLSVTIPGESKVSYTYNSQNRLASVTRTNLTGVGTANQSLTTTYAYTLYSDGIVEKLVVTQPSPSGTDHTTYAYDTHGNLTSVTDGVGHITTYSGYNGLGEVGKVVGPNGDETDYAYDARGRVATKTTHPNGGAAAWTYAYDGFGLLAKVSAPDGEVTTWTRDAEKRVKAITHNDKDGASTETFAYDANADVISDVTARGSDVGKKTTCLYNALGKVYQVKGSHGQVLTYAYDGNGNVLSVTDALGHKTSYAYDALNRMVGVTNAVGGITSYAYDAGDHVMAVEDPRGLVTEYMWDGLGQLWQQQSPDTGTTTFSYDGYGRLATKTPADGIKVSYAYDALNRLTSELAGGVTQIYTWDVCANGKGRFCAANTQGYSNVSYAYSPEGWITARAFLVSGAPSYTVGYGYDNMGHLAAVNYPDGNQALYDYSNGAVSDVHMKIGGSILNGATGITYRPMDLAMSSWTSSNGLTNTITYDSDLRPTKLIVPGVQAIVYTYDAANRLTGINDGYNPPNLDETLTYDALGRLTTASSPSENESYTYDADGNRTYQVVNGLSISYAYASGSNRLVSSSEPGAAPTSYGYDADGNTATINGLAAYTYGPFGRLVNAGGTAFVVSAEGQRIRKSGGTGDTFFAPGAEGELLAENNSGTWSDYIWLNGRLVGFVRSGTLYAIHGDHLGRPEAVTAPSKLTVWRASDYPFTQNVDYDNLGAFNLGFPGQYRDAEDDLWHNGARDYNPWLGRYIESDPIGLAGGVNTYAYVGNNPISNVDPLGLKCGCNQGQSTGGQNNVGQPASGLNMNDWQFAQELAAGDSATVDSSGGIAIQTGGTAGPLGTDQFGYYVTQRPLAQNGGYEPVAAPMNWGNPTYYSSGFVGSGGTNTMIFSAMPGAGGNRWFVNFPAQESAHGNAANEYLDIYVPRCN